MTFIYKIVTSILIIVSVISAREFTVGTTEAVGADLIGRNKQVGNTKLEGIALSGGYLLVADYSSSALNKSNSLDAKLAAILKRNGPELRPMRDFKDFSDISLSVAKRAWQLMHKHAETAIRERLNLMWPLADEALRSAQVTPDCHRAAYLTVEAAKRLESWAVQLLSSWGNFPPVGIYEGTFGDIGSYHGCLNVPENKVIDHAHYCSISYQPVLPNRSDYELLMRKEPVELLELFASSEGEQEQKREESDFTDAFTDLLSNAQYSHYIYYKFGTCFPIQCSPVDVQKLAKLLGERSVLINGPIKCHSKYEQDYHQVSSTSLSSSTNSTRSQLKISTRDLNNGVYIWKPHITRTQVVALVLVGLILVIIFSLTFVDLAVNILPKLYKNFHTLEKKLSQDDDRASEVKGNPASVATSNKYHDQKVYFNVREQNSKQNGDQLKDDDVDNHMDANNNNKSEQKAFNSSPLMVAANKTYQNQREISKVNMYELADVEVAVDLDVKVREVSLIGTESALANSTFISRGKLLKEKEEEEQQVVGRFCGKENELNRRKKSLVLSRFMNIVKDYSIVTNGKQFFQVNPNALRDDILCINGIRCITMSWIIITHTMQYNDWAAFARTREIETHLKSLINQPLFNASYLVDTFFLISGLLTSFSSFKSVRRKLLQDETDGNHKETNKTEAGAAASLLKQFSARSYLIGRYLRLTPQIMLISLLFILLPLLSGKAGGPSWYTITGEYSENCAQNWWVNLFHIQAFYRSNEMCNFVSWWISVDMFYHLFALALILLILRFGYYQRTGWSNNPDTGLSSSFISSGKRAREASSGDPNQQLAGADRVGSALLLLPKTFTAPVACAALSLAHAIPQLIRHYQLKMPPNLLSTIPQTGAMWSEMTLKLFWTPYAHAFPFFLGFYLGHLMAERSLELQRWFTRKRILAGWSATGLLLISQSYSTYFWVVGTWNYSRFASTLFFLVSPVIWSSCLAWIILACHYKHGGFVNRFLSCRLFIILGKASFIVYLSHFLVLFTFFGSQNLLLEPTQLLMLYVIIGNICLSMLLGSLLCIVFEVPWLKTQRRLMKFLRS